MLTNELPLFPAWIIAPYVLKYICFVEGIERCPSCIDVFHAGFLSETLISWISKLHQITTVILTPALWGLFFTANQFFPYHHNSSSEIQHISLKTAHQQLDGPRRSKTSCCSFLPFSSFTTLGFCNMLLWSRCGYLKPVSAAVSLGH